MRPLYLARLDEIRPVVLLTRAIVRPYLTRVTVAPVTWRVRGLSTEVAVDVENGLDRDGAISCDDITTIAADRLLERIGYLRPDQEPALTTAILAAYDLE